MREGLTQYAPFCTGGLAANHKKDIGKTPAENKPKTSNSRQKYVTNHQKLHAMCKNQTHTKTEQTAYRAGKLYLNTIFVEKILLPVLNNHR